MYILKDHDNGTELNISSPSEGASFALEEGIRDFEIIKEEKELTTPIKDISRHSDTLLVAIDKEVEDITKIEPLDSVKRIILTQGAWCVTFYMEDDKE